MGQFIKALRILEDHYTFRGHLLGGNVMESRGGARSRHRKFYELPPEGEENEVFLQANGKEAKAERQKLTDYINSSVIGNNATFLRCGLHVDSHNLCMIFSSAPLEGKLFYTATTLPLVAVLSS